jgi:hypothetical protein
MAEKKGKLYGEIKLSKLKARGFSRVKSVNPWEVSEIIIVGSCVFESEGKFLRCINIRIGEVLRTEIKVSILFSNEYEKDDYYIKKKEILDLDSFFTQQQSNFTDGNGSWIRVAAIFVKV